MDDIVAIVPARGGSQGIPGKNLKEIGGDPLVGIAVSQATQSEEITHTVANSDASEIRAAAKEYGADQILDRPDRFAGGDTVMEVDRLLQWQVEYLEEQGQNVDVVVLLYPTGPLRSVEKIDETIRKVTEEGCDSALTLYEDDRYLWKTDGEAAQPTNYDPKKRGPRQLEEWNQWAENKAVYVVKRDLLMDTGCRLGGNIGYVEMSELRSVDVDTPTDLELARRIVETDGKSW
ncbi:N-acylneuraminate cytidylyltransferase [Haloferax larsenii JCM 13917]|nr:acylneuraminate cytidylyltransferase family protein [Haloferax larsenii]ELZ81339.1 N-acylneuraminate cytidylyltransferase [Haloferax larsenii JCM 13917]